MAWVRARQLSAETQSLADVDGLTGTTGATISSTEKYTGEYSYRFFGTGQPIGIGGLSHTAARAQMFFRHNGVTGSGFAPIIGMMVDGAPVVWGLNLSTGEVTLRAGWVFGTSTVRFPVTVTTAAIAAINQWYSIGMTAFFAETGFVSLWVNGLQIATWEENTKVFRSGQTIERTLITGCYVAGGPSNWMTGTSSWTSATYTDDFYVDVWDGVGGDPIDASPPSRRFLAVFPTGAGANTQWTPNTGANWAAVDEAPPDNETTYVKAMASDLLDTYDFGAVTVPADHAVRAVIPMAYARKSDAGTDSQIKLAVVKGSTVRSDAQALPTSYGYVWERWEMQPDGTTPWDETAVNAAEFGVESAGTF